MAGGGGGVKEGDGLRRNPPKSRQSDTLPENRRKSMESSCRVGDRRPAVRHSARNLEVSVHRNVEVGDRGGCLYFVSPTSPVHPMWRSLRPASPTHIPLLTVEQKSELGMQLKAKMAVVLQPGLRTWSNTKLWAEHGPWA